jgi:microcystin-dependent protein
MSSPFLGEVRMFGFNFPPRNWAYCNGQLLPISQNTALFALLGTQYGGNGLANFALPNLQASVVVGRGQGPGLTDRTSGEVGGSATVTLTTPEMPSHSHAVTVSDLPADRSNATGNVLGVPSDPVYAGGPPTRSTSPVTAQPTGVGLPHNNLSPYLAVNFCIALQGIFPSRN